MKINQPSTNELKQLLSNSVDDVIHRDMALLKSNASEWSVAHRLAVYLERHFRTSPSYSPDYSVDCEYDRETVADTKVTRSKRGDYQRHNDAQSQSHDMRPDVILHRRGVEENIMVVELKKSSGRLVLKQDDAAKLSLLSRDTKNGGKGYHLGVYLEFDKNGFKAPIYFEAGEQCVVGRDEGP